MYLYAIFTSCEKENLQTTYCTSKYVNAYTVAEVVHSNYLQKVHLILVIYGFVTSMKQLQKPIVKAYGKIIKVHPMCRITL
jgi:hypothetical protein